MPTLITDSVMTHVQPAALTVNDPLDPIWNTLPRKWCKSCERVLEETPAVRTDKHFGGADVRGGDVPVQDRIMEMRELPPAGSGVWVHRWMTGQLCHEESVRRGY